jgi:restriction system protein
MRLGKKAIDLSPEEFEKTVQRLLHVLGAELHSFETSHREVIPSDDGAYEIDITARFKALGLDFLVLIECKKQQRPVERSVIQVLYDKIRAAGAHKGIVFSTGGFQTGAIQYAARHGIALIAVAPGHMVYQVRDLHSASKIIWFKAGPISLWHTLLDEHNRESYHALICQEDLMTALRLDALSET